MKMAYYSYKRCNFKGGLELCIIISIVWETACGQIRYSIPEEMDKYSFVGNIAKDLGLDVKDLSERSVRIVSRGRTQYFVLSLEDGYLHINEQIDRENICGQIDQCLLHFDIVAQNPVALYRAEVEIQDINDHAPSFPKDEIVLDISEISAPGTRMSLPKANDPDVGLNSLQKYQLIHSEYFNIDMSNEASLKKHAELLLKKTLDREEVPIHDLVLIATDGGDPVRSGTMHIRIVVLDVNDNPPVFTQSVYKVSVTEGADEGTLLTTVKATDADEGSSAEVTYSFSSIPVNPSPKIRVDPKKGSIHLTGKLDFEEAQLYEVEIQAKDSGGLVARSKVVIEVIDLNDNPPQITITTLSSSVSEDSAPGTVIAIFNIHDIDSGENGQVICSVPEHLPFHLEESFDNYYSLVTGRLLDREEVSEYNITITAIDKGNPPLSTTQSILLLISDVNDNPPVFAQTSYSVYVMENNPTAASIFSVKATDLDWDQNSRVTYSITNNIADEVPLFSCVAINRENGVIYALRSFDYEQFREFQIQVEAQDGGSPSLSSNVTITIFILDRNDNTPEILYPSLPSDGSTGVELAPRSSNPGYLVTKVVAVDADSGQNAWLSYQLLRATDSGLFTVGFYNGEVTTSRHFLDKDAHKQTVVILVKDNGQPVLSATVTITIVVANSVAELFSDLSNLSSPESTGSNLTLYLVVAIACVSCVFLIFLIVLLALRLHRWKKSQLFDSSSSNFNGLPTSQFIGIDGVRAFLQDVSLTTDSVKKPSMYPTVGNANSLTNNSIDKDLDLIFLQDGNLCKENALSKEALCKVQIIPMMKVMKTKHPQYCASLHAARILIYTWERLIGSEGEGLPLNYLNHSCH
ncbi:protocadherin gamma-A11-like [Rhinatrema bivittatum]|uniref:protocadherin gamma-A11-like n=1 Tax=Rhinatrema bivittatum TaxID=194408 RepID=UPI001129C4EE|nr:protocadherin gamma-A11-like [Rhinatrema bivittatum]